MNICDVLKPEHIVCGLEGSEKFEVINNLLKVVKNDDRVDDFNQISKSVIEREKIMSTGVGKSLAIPHAKTKGVNDIIAAFATTQNEIDFESIDQEPVKIIFLLIGEEKNVAAHIKLLSRISRMMNNDDFRTSLLKAESCKEIFSMFKKEEAKYEAL